MSLSEPDLRKSDKKHLFDSGFPPGVTVDELRHYRKKKAPAYSTRYDTLKPEEGSFKLIKSEYKKKFKSYRMCRSHDDLLAEPSRVEVSLIRGTKPEDSLKLRGPIELNPEYRESFIEHSLEGSKTTFECQAEITNLEHPEKSCSAEPHRVTGIKPPHPFRRPTILKLEGTLLTTTENAENFVEYLIEKRADLLRKSTNLHLTGAIETPSETKDKYILFDHKGRPPLCKKSTNLHLEGNLEISTENREQYHPYETLERPVLQKRNTNLHLEGSLELLPEYRDVYVPHKVEKLPPWLPINHLKSEVLQNPETAQLAIHQVAQEEISGNGKLPLDSDETVTKNITDDLNFEGVQNAPENKMHSVVHKPATNTIVRKPVTNFLLEGRIDKNPEYRNAYLDFHTEKGASTKKSPRRRRRTVTHPIPNLHTGGGTETYNEYKFANLPKQRSLVKHPENIPEYDAKLSHVTEKRAPRSVKYFHGPKTNTSQPQQEVHIEGSVECHPEYRRAYNDYLIREKAERKPRPLNSLGIQPKRIFDDAGKPNLDVDKDTKPPDEVKTQEATGTSTLVTVTSPKDTTDNKAVPPLKRPTSISTHHLPPPAPARQPKRQPDNTTKSKTLSTVEKCAFGPKVQLPTSTCKQSSRRTTHYEQRSSVHQELPRPTRFHDTIIVENMALSQQRSSPLPPVEPTSACKQKWLTNRDEDESIQNTAFIVLGQVSTNTRCDGDNNYAGDLTYKEQKWMPSWYDPPF